MCAFPQVNYFSICILLHHYFTITIIHVINCARKSFNQMKNDLSSCERNLCNCVRSLKKKTDFNEIWANHLKFHMNTSFPGLLLAPPAGARGPWERSFMVFKKKRVENVKRTIKQSPSVLIDIIRLYTSRKTAVPCRMTCASSALAITVLLFSGEWSDNIMQIATVLSRNEVFHFFHCEVALNEQMEHCIR